MRWIIVATLVAIVGIGLGLAVLRSELRVEPHDFSSGSQLAPGQPLRFYRDDAVGTCKRRGVEQIAREFDVAPTPEAAAMAYATAGYSPENYGFGPQQAVYEGCLEGFRD